MNKKLLVTIYVIVSFTVLVLLIRSSMSESQPVSSLRKGDASVIGSLTDISIQINIAKDYSLQPEQTSVTLEVLRLPALSSFPEYSQLCVNQITLDVQGEYKSFFPNELTGDYKKWADTRLYKFKDTCLLDENIDLRGTELSDHLSGAPTHSWDGVPFRVNVINPSNYYPFDTFVLDITATLEGVVVDQNGNSSIFSRLPVLDGYATVPNWRKRSEITQRKPPYEIQNKQIVHFYRPIIQLGFILVLFGSVFILIASLLTIEENGSVLEISIGILLGLWGIQDIIIPKDLSPSFTQSIILSLYVFLLITLAIRFLFINRLWNKTQPALPNDENLATSSQNLPIDKIQSNDNYIESLSSKSNPTDSPSTDKSTRLLPNINILAIIFSLLAFLTSLLYFWKKTKRD